MGERTGYAEGTFCWVDLATTDAQGAKDFYGGLFGWEPVDQPAEEGVYTMFKLDGKDVAAMYEQPAGQSPPSWLSYVSVDDVDARTSRAKELGGKVLLEPFDVMIAGRMALLRDPTGAIFALWQAGSHFGAQRVNDPGCLTWNQLSTDDLDAAERFYTALFGWRAQTIEAGEGTFTIWLNGDNRNGGMMALPPDSGPPHWLAYFTVEDLEAACARVGERGGRVVLPPTEIPAGRIAVAHDPQGAHFAFWEGEVDP